MENKKEAKKEDDFADDEEIEGTPRKLNFWVVSTVILAVLLIATLMFGTRVTGNAISAKDASTKALNTINTYFAQDAGAKLSGKVTDDSGLYKVGLDYNNNELFVYLTKDGKYLILPNGIVTIAELEATKEPAAQPPQEDAIAKTDKPSVELFVMCFCPYGVKAENNILPIIELFGDKIDFKVKFIVNVKGNTINDVQSLHGIDEAKEDARQVIIMKYYPDKFYSYLKDMNNDCYSVAQDGAKLDECWKKAAQKLGFDIKKIETAAYGEEGINLLKQNEADADKYGVSGSPTLVINGVKSSAIYSGTAATQQAICSAFNTAPVSECGTEVTVTGTATADPSEQPQCG